MTVGSWDGSGWRYFLPLESLFDQLLDSPQKNQSANFLQPPLRIRISDLFTAQHLLENKQNGAEVSRECGVNLSLSLFVWCVVCVVLCVCVCVV